MYMHLIERGKVAKPLNINTNGVNKKINIILCISTLLSQSVIMCCSLIRESVRAAAHYKTRALQKIVIVPLFYINVYYII